MPLISSRTTLIHCPVHANMPSVSLTTTQLSKYFNRPISDISWGITAVLMLRSAGSIIFGIASDRWGRKWPFIVNMLLFIVLELGAGFAQTWPQFMACRALFGVGECLRSTLVRSLTQQPWVDCLEMPPPPRWKIVRMRRAELSQDCSSKDTLWDTCSRPLWLVVWSTRRLMDGGLFTGFVLLPSATTN